MHVYFKSLYYRHRTRRHNSSNSGGEEFNEVIDEDPVPSTSANLDATNARSSKIVNSALVYFASSIKYCLYRAIADIRHIFHRFG